MGGEKFRRRSKSREAFFETRRPKYYFLVVTNGKSTEFFYFSDLSQSLPKGTVQIKPEFHNGNPTAVVQKARTFVGRGQFDEVWAVFDKDEFPDFDAAVTEAELSNVHPGYSNPSFELWLLLHFQEVTSALDRNACTAKLEQHLQQNIAGFRYDKAQDQKVLALVTEHGDQECALRRGRQLQDDHPFQPWRENPSTAVHKLIAQIRAKVAKVTQTGT